MGKVALLVVLATGIASATILFTSQETDVRSAAVQGEYEADVIAREIARSAFNSASADVHRFGTDIDAAINNFGTLITSADMPEDQKCANGKATCARRTGDMLDGTYVVEASYDGGNGVDIYSSGTFSYNAGGEVVTADHDINESQTVGVLRVSEGGLLRIQFVDSMAGYCSAIFLKRTLPGVAEEDQPLPEMVYAPGNRRNGERNIGIEVELDPGTQMNFAIGVDTSCGGGGTRPNSRPEYLRNGAAQAMRDSNGDGRADSTGLAALADSMATYQYLESDWAWVHWALDASTVSLDDPREGRGRWSRPTPTTTSAGASPSRTSTTGISTPITGTTATRTGACGRPRTSVTTGSGASRPRATTARAMGGPTTFAPSSRPKTPAIR